MMRNADDEASFELSVIMCLRQIMAMQTIILRTVSADRNVVDLIMQAGNIDKRLQAHVKALIENTKGPASKN